MRDFMIGDDAAGQRLDRYLLKLLPEAGNSFLQKMIRKKRIKLNGARTESSAILHDGDSVRLYFSEETIAAFRGEQKPVIQAHQLPDSIRDAFEHPVYEDANYLGINKPAGLLSQPDHSGAISAAEAAETYLNKTATFSPAPLYRLDRNTSGILLFPKNYEAQRRALEAIRKRDCTKEYITIISGVLTSPGTLRSSLVKNPETNQVFPVTDDSGREAILEYDPVSTEEDYTLMTIRLLTGRTHQIRAQLEQNGTPVVGDEKYGAGRVNREFNSRFGIRRQMLHAAYYALHDENGLFLEAEAPLPDDFSTAVTGLFGNNALAQIDDSAIFS